MTDIQATNAGASGETSKRNGAEGAGPASQSAIPNNPASNSGAANERPLSAAGRPQAIIRDCLDGKNGREQTPNWRPGWPQFPALAYTGAGKPGAVQRAEKIAPLFAE